MARFNTRTKLLFASIGIALLFFITAAYDLQEVYNANRGNFNQYVQRIPGLGTTTAPLVSFGKWAPDTFKLGLDLKGGAQLIYTTDLSEIPQAERADAVEGLRDVIERRIDNFGVAEPIVQTVKAGDEYRIVAELAGVYDVNRAIQIIGDTPKLEFKESQDISGPDTRELTPKDKKEMDEFNAAAERNAKKALDEVGKKGADFSKIAKRYSEEQEVKEQGGDLGWISPGGAYNHLYAVASTVKKGTFFADRITGPDGISILKLVDSRAIQKEVSASHVLICYEGAQNCESKKSKDEARDFIDDLKKQAAPENFFDLAKEHSTEPAAKSSGGDLGYFKKGMMVKEFEDVAFALEKGKISDVFETAFGFHILYKKDERPLTEYRVSRILFKTKKREDFLAAREPWKDTGLTGKQLKKSYVSTDQQTLFPEVGLEFNDQGKKLFGDITSRNVGKPLAIFLDGVLMQAPRVNQAITDGSAVITGDFTLTEVKETVRRLNAGALPVPISLISQQTVGATLGEESLARSMQAGLIGFFLVMLFMIFVYRLPGVLAVGSLLVYTLFVLAIFKIWPVTLSLAGIAGFILSVGMAVDANVLIFERMKEELRTGKSLEHSIKDGFARAWTSIRDSNISSLITCMILFLFSASLIKGFALTLAIGILVSMFTAISVTRLSLRIISRCRIGKIPWLFCSRIPKPSTLYAKPSV